MEKLATLKPVFGTGEGATMTAANSTPLTDGASAVLLASDEWAAAQGLPVLAHLIDAQTAAVDYVHGGEGLLMAPVYAMPVMLARNGLTLQDFDFYEIHEAFASTVLSTMKAWEDAAFCKGKLGLDAPLGSIDRVEAERQRLVAGGRAPVRRDRRPDRRPAGQDAARGGPGQARPDLHLCGRRPGRRRHPRVLTHTPPVRKVRDGLAATFRRKSASERKTSRE